MLRSGFYVPHPLCYYFWCTNSLAVTHAMLWNVIFFLSNYLVASLRTGNTLVILQAPIVFKRQHRIIPNRPLVRRNSEWSRVFIPMDSTRFLFTKSPKRNTKKVYLIRKHWYHDSWDKTRHTYSSTCIFFQGTHVSLFNKNRPSQLLMLYNKCIYNSNFP